MKPVFKKRFIFIAKSMLWSMLLYVVLMLAFNWDDVNNKVKSSNPITVMSNITSPQTPEANNPAAIPPSIAHNMGFAEKIITLARNISGIIGIAIK